MMRIVVNAIPLLSSKTGVGQYIYNICRNIEHLDEENIYTYFYGYFSNQIIETSEHAQRKIKNIKAIARNVPLIGRYLAGFKDKLAQLNTNITQVQEFDLYYEPNFIPIMGIKARKKVVTVHDLSFKLHPYWFPTEENKAFNKRFDRALSSIDHFITVSHYVKDEMIASLGLDERQVSVVYNGYNKNIFKVYQADIIRNTLIKFGIDRPYILYIGTLEPRKNIISLLKAYKELPLYMRNEYKLVLAGANGWLNGEVYDYAEGVLIDSTIFTGYVSDYEVAHLMNGASVFVYPSFYEGFGLPPLEAMACGTPVIVSDTSSMLELYADVAYMIDPNDFITIKVALEKILNDEQFRNGLIKKGTSFVEKFDWKLSAKQTLEIFSRI